MTLARHSEILPTGSAGSWARRQGFPLPRPAAAPPFTVHSQQLRCLLAGAALPYASVQGPCFHVHLQTVDMEACALYVDGEREQSLNEGVSAMSHEARGADWSQNRPCVRQPHCTDVESSTPGISLMPSFQSRALTWSCRAATSPARAAAGSGSRVAPRLCAIVRCTTASDTASRCSATSWAAPKPVRCLLVGDGAASRPYPGRGYVSELCLGPVYRVRVNVQARGQDQHQGQLGLGPDAQVSSHGVLDVARCRGARLV